MMPVALILLQSLLVAAPAQARPALENDYIRVLSIAPGGSEPLPASRPIVYIYKGGAVRFIRAGRAPGAAPDWLCIELKTKPAGQGGRELTLPPGVASFDTDMLRVVRVKCPPRAACEDGLHSGPTVYVLLNGLGRYKPGTAMFSKTPLRFKNETADTTEIIRIDLKTGL